MGEQFIEPSHSTLLDGHGHPLNMGIRLHTNIPCMER